MNNLTIYPDKPSWLKARPRSIGASDTAKILGLTSMGSEFSTYLEKAEGLPSDNRYEQLTKWGSLLEPVVREEYQSVTGRTVHYDGAYAVAHHPDLPWMTCTLDGRIEPDAVYEGKTAIAYSRSNWDDGVPLPYQVQVQHQLFVTGRQWGSVACLIGGNDFRYYDIPRNDDFINEVMLPKLDEFWHRVQTKTPPDIDGSEATREATRRLDPYDDGATTEFLDIEWETVERWKDLKAKIKQLTDEKERLQAEIEYAMGGYTFALLPDGSMLSYKTQTRPSYQVKESTFRVLREVKGKKGK